MKIKNKVISFAFVLIFIAMPLVSCSQKAEYQKKYIFAMDTDITIYIDAARDATELISLCEQMIYSLEDTVSKTRTGSDIYRLNAGERVECDPVTVYLLSACFTVNELSNGSFDPTVAGLVSMWEECEEQNALPSESELREKLSLVGLDGVYMHGDEVWLGSGVCLNLGGIAKGYALDAVSELIEENAQTYGVRGYMLDFGGMVGVFGEKPSGEKYKIGLKDPDDPQKNRGIVELCSGIVSVSGDYERFYTVEGERYHHIIDPKTGYPADSGVSSVAVICDDGALADALSTAFFIMGYERTLEIYELGMIEFEAVFFMKNGSTLKTEGAAYSN